MVFSAFFPSLPGILGFGKDKRSLFIWGFSLPFSKKPGEEGQGLGAEFAGPEKLGLAPKVLKSFGALQNLSSTGFLLCETFCRTFLQNPKGAAEFWGTFGIPSLSFQALQFRENANRALVIVL